MVQIECWGAVDLYEAGYANYIVMVRNMVRGYDLVVSQGVDIPHDTDITREVAVQLGVPEEKVKILPGDASSTQDEAMQVRGYLNRKLRGEKTALPPLTYPVPPALRRKLSNVTTLLT